MSFKPAKCPNCAGDIQVPDDRDTAKCMYCGSDIIVREAIKAAAGGVNIENLMMLAKTAAVSKRYEDSHAYYSKVLEHDAKNVDAWIGEGITKMFLIFNRGGGGDFSASKYSFDAAVNASKEQSTTKAKIIDEISKAYFAYYHQGYSKPLRDILHGGNIHCFEIIHSLDTNNTSGLIVEGRKQLRLSNYSKAIEYFQKALLTSNNDQDVAEIIIDQFIGHACQYLKGWASDDKIETFINQIQPLFHFSHKIRPMDRRLEEALVGTMKADYLLTDENRELINYCKTLVNEIKKK